MNSVIDLGPELLVDESTIRDPYLRLLTAAVGQKLAPGSPWVAVNKRVAVICRLPFGSHHRAPQGPAPLESLTERRRPDAAAHRHPEGSRDPDAEVRRSNKPDARSRRAIGSRNV